MNSFYQNKMEKTLVFILLLFSVSFSTFGKDETVIPVLKEDLLKDEIFIRFTGQAKRIYVWKPKTAIRIHRKPSLEDWKQYDQFIKDMLGCDIYDTISVQSTKYKLRYRETSNEKRWSDMYNDRYFCSNPILLIKVHDIYQCSDSMSYCLVQLFYAYRCYEYEYFIKKEDGKWAIIFKNLLSRGMT